MTMVFAVVVKEFRQISRDRRTLTILLFVPAFFLLLYGYALSFDIRTCSIVPASFSRTIDRAVDTTAVSIAM